ncbi:MAG: hypothetical protein KKF95_04705 [Nanoarchaeota archaeon]|nr:hypothetical protein [Nanoarchaeota archaeon]MBU2443346.1 hypothetical protein [Nanoarchaeota archaeon]
MHLKMFKMNTWKIAGLISVVIISFIVSLYLNSEPSEVKVELTGQDACNELINKAARDDCLNNYELEELDKSLEEVKQEYASVSVEDMKLLARALRDNDKSLCDGIIDSYAKDKCFND